MDLPQNETATPGPDYGSLLAEAWNDIYEAKLGLAQILILRVIFRYSFRVKQAAAWIPSHDVFEMHTSMGKKEIIETLEKLQSYKILEEEPAPMIGVLPEGRFPHGKRYKFFPRSTRAWSIAPRVTKKRLTEKAASIDRWLLAINAGGDPAQADLFPPLWDHADTLAEWSVRSVDAPQVTPDAPTTQSVQLPNFDQESEDVRSADAPQVTPDAHAPQIAADESSARSVDAPQVTPDAPYPQARGEKPHGEKPHVGKNPTGCGEKPHAPINVWNELNETYVSLKAFNALMEPPVGKNPTLKQPARERASHWCSLEVERKWMKRYTQLVDAWYADAQARAYQKSKFGGLWRSRVREYTFGVQEAFDKAVREWAEVQGLGEYLNNEFLKLYRPFRQKQMEERARAYEDSRDQPAEQPPPTGPANREDVQRMIEASLREGGPE